MATRKGQKRNDGLLDGCYGTFIKASVFLGTAPVILVSKIIEISKEEKRELWI